MTKLEQMKRAAQRGYNRAVLRNWRRQNPHYNRPEYCCGFLFQADHVLLIEKQKPAWQKGLNNGPGGLIELGEAPYEAMRREFFEECGAHVIRWDHFARFHNSYCVVHFFKSFEPTAGIHTKTNERVRWVSLRLLSMMPVVPNLRWLIPAALNTQGPEIRFSEAPLGVGDSTTPHSGLRPW